jgi:hypothetical protein
MALVLLEGLDRTGKSTVAKFFESKGYEVVHLSAPGKEFHAGNTYLDAMVDLLQRGASRDLVIDRTHYGELVWPQVYGRKPLLTEEDYEILREIEDSIGVKRILMHDPNAEAHWQRCVDNKEPLTKAQFARARSIYATMGAQHGFESITLPAFCKEFGLDEELGPPNKPATQQETSSDAPQQSGNTPQRSQKSGPVDQRQLLEKANAINDILEKRILKKGGALYDDLENDVRTFLNSKLAAIFGNSGSVSSLSPEEIVFFKAMYKRVTEKEN